MKTLLLLLAILTFTCSFSQNHVDESYLALKSDLKKMDNRLKCPPENVLYFDTKINGKGQIKKQKVTLANGKVFCTYKFKYKKGEIAHKKLSHSKFLDRYFSGKFFYRDGNISMVEYKDSKFKGNDLKVYTKTIMFKKNGGTQSNWKQVTYRGNNNTSNLNNYAYQNNMTTYPTNIGTCNNASLRRYHKLTHPKFNLNYFNEKFEYDRYNRIESRNFYDKYHRKLGSIEYDYDRSGRLEEIKYYVNYRKVGSIDIEYYRNGNVESIVYKDGYGRRL